jgi:hypothetical protein
MAMIPGIQAPAGSTAGLLLRVWHVGPLFLRPAHNPHHARPQPCTFHPAAPPMPLSKCLESGYLMSVEEEGGVKALT